MTSLSRRAVLAATLASAALPAYAGQFDCLVEPRQSIDIRPARRHSRAWPQVPRAVKVRSFFCS